MGRWGGGDSFLVIPICMEVNKQCFLATLCQVLIRLLIPDTLSELYLLTRFIFL